MFLLLADATLDDLVFHHLTKAALAVVLVIVWYRWVRNKAVPFGTSLNSDKPRAFPFYSLLFTVVLTCGFAYYVGMEHAFRDTTKVPDSLGEQHAQDQHPALTPVKVVTEKSLEERLKEAAAESKEQNAEAKAAFIKSAKAAHESDNAEKP